MLTRNVTRGHSRSVNEFVVVVVEVLVSVFEGRIIEEVIFFCSLFSPENRYVDFVEQLVLALRGRE